MESVIACSPAALVSVTPETRVGVVIAPCAGWDDAAFVFAAPDYQPAALTLSRRIFLRSWLRPRRALDDDCSEPGAFLRGLYSNS